MKFTLNYFIYLIECGLAGFSFGIGEHFLGVICMLFALAAFYCWVALDQKEESQGSDGK